MKRLGPELKMPKLKGGEMKVPAFVSDFYYDLRERRLLPLIGLILTAIVAAPILLSQGSNENESPPVPPFGSENAPVSKSLTVVKAAPGLRNYKKRLGHRSPTNPFKQRFTAPQLEGQLNEPTTTTTTTETSSQVESTPPPETTVPSTTNSETGSPEGTGGGSTGKGGDNEDLPEGLTLFTFAIDVEITRIEAKPDGSVAETGPTLHKEVMPPTPLPGKKAAVTTYLGMGVKTEAPLFLVSPEVTQVFGKGECVAGTPTGCQLFSLPENSQETFEYGPNHIRYKIKVAGVKPVVTGHS